MLCDSNQYHLVYSAYLRTYHAYELPDAAFTAIGGCRPVGEPEYESFKAAQDVLWEHSIETPQIGFNAAR